MKDRSRLDRWIAVLSLMGAGVILARLVERMADGPTIEMNASRLATAIGLARGFNIMPGPDEGPLLDFMYGPMYAVAYAPAALADSPSVAIWIGTVLSLLFTLVPFAWFGFRASEKRSRLLAASAIVCFGILAVYDAALDWAAWTIHADAPALAFAGCACACLQSRRELLTSRQMGFAALFAVLAVWSKQIAFPIVVALPLFIWLRDGWRTAFRFGVWMAATGVLVSLVFVAWFGFGEVLFNMFQVPGGHPWKSRPEDGSRLGALVASFGRLAALSRLPGVVVITIAVTTYRRGTSVREWLRENPWTCLAWVALLMVPTATLGGAKVGGEVNNFAVSTYFMNGAAVLGLVQLASSMRTVARRLAQLALAGIVIFGVGAELVSSDRRSIFFDSVTELREWRNNPQERATAFARAHPEQVHFVGNPLVGLFSDGRLYSSVLGKLDRQLAGFATSPDLMLSHGPRRLRYVALRRSMPFKGLRLPEYAFCRKVVQPRRLPHYVVWECPLQRD